MEDFFFHFYKKLVTSGYLKTGYLIGYLRVEVTRGHQKKKHALGGVVRLVLVSFLVPKIKTIFFEKWPQLQSKSSEMCSDTSLTLLGTSPTTLFMIMIGFGHYFVIFVFFWSRFGLARTHPPPSPRGRGGVSVTVLRSRT